MNLLFTCTLEGPLNPWEGKPFVERMQKSLQENNPAGHQFVENPADAEIILYFEANYFKDRKYAHLLLQQEMIRKYPQKCFVYSYDDFPVGFLRGLYVGVAPGMKESPRFRTWCYPEEPNPEVKQQASRRAELQPDLLASFRGSLNAEVRHQLFAHRDLFGSEAIIERPFSNKFYDHSRDEQKAYVEEILRSRFVLCPRGLGNATHRLFEVMQLGRVPVILSDDYVFPQGPDWPDFSIRLKEGEVSELPKILRSRNGRAREMGMAARKNWEKWFAPDVRLTGAIQQIKQIAQKNGADETRCQETWLSDKFFRAYGLGRWQSFVKNLRQGTLLKKVVRKIFKK